MAWEIIITTSMGDKQVFTSSLIDPNEAVIEVLKRPDATLGAGDMILIEEDFDEA